ncbi:MAG: (R)-citramalate synthase [Candidatus Binatia bacterium]|nr:MAG: (R)-citramalate synthase [Candidatus Binatia bacterium]
MKRQVEIYDTTLRDGAQAEDVSFTLHDKFRILERLDDFGIHVVEGGWPGSNPKDVAFFREARKLRLRHARLAAFGSTRRAHVKAAEDENLRLLVEAETPVVTIFGKTWDLHVREDLRIPLEANLEVIYDSVRFLEERCDRVIFDAEHFFDGFRQNPEYALECIEAAAQAGADLVVLCDTNGGRLPGDIRDGVEAARKKIATPVGIHCHNDADLAVANSLVAVEHGAVQVQGTINGFGERCGNANLCSIVANLQLKMGYSVVSPGQLERLQELSRFVYELANLEPNKRQPYVGASAFAHKGGIHVAAVQKNPRTYEHIDPRLVGNRQRVLLSDLAGRANVLYKAREFGIPADKEDPAVRRIVQQLKELESQGYQFEGAEASFELLLKKELDGKLRHFRLIGFRVIDEKRSEDETPISEATIMIEGPDGEIEHTAAQGNGPVNALDRALRKALRKFYPQIDEVKLLDYKVRVLGGHEGTGAMVRVLIESGDGTSRWGTVGVSHNVIEASWKALVDSIDYKLYKDERQRRRVSKGRSRRASAEPERA